MPHGNSKKTSDPGHPNQFHQCQILYDENEFLPRPAPYASCYERLMYRWQKARLVANKGFDYEQFFRSRHSILREKLRQIRQYPRTIHPFSVANFFREQIVNVILQVLFIVSPGEKTFSSIYERKHQNKSPHVDQIEGLCFILHALLGLDIIWCFHLGYICTNEKEIVLDKWKIRKRYLKTYFFVDLICFIYSILTYFCRNSEIGDFMYHIPIHYIRLVRIFSVREYVIHLFQFMKFNDIMIRSLSAIIVNMYILHWLTCFIFYLPMLNYYYSHSMEDSFFLANSIGLDRPIINLYVHTLSVVVYHFFGVGRGSFESTNPTELAVLAFITMFGMCLQILLIGIMLQLVSSHHVSETKYEELCYELKEYMKAKILPHHIQHRVNLFLAYKFQKHFFHEDIILNSMSEHLRCEVILYSNRSLIDNASIFRNESKTVIGRILSLLKYEIYMPNDLITAPDMLCTKLFFINYGTVGVYRSDGRELRHYEDGATFGGIAMLIESDTPNYVSTIIALETTSIAYLDRDGFTKVSEEFPETFDKLRSAAGTRLRKSKLTPSEEEIIDTVLGSLKQGRVLEQPMPRTRFLTNIEQ